MIARIRSHGPGGGADILVRICRIDIGGIAPLALPTLLLLLLLLHVQVVVAVVGWLVPPSEGQQGRLKVWVAGRD